MEIRGIQLSKITSRSRKSVWYQFQDHLVRALGLEPRTYGLKVRKWCVLGVVRTGHSTKARDSTGVFADRLPALHAGLPCLGSLLVPLPSLTAAQSGQLFDLIEKGCRDLK